MRWEFVVVLILAVAVIAFPALLWFYQPINTYRAIREIRKRKPACRDK